MTENHTFKTQRLFYSVPMNKLSEITELLMEFKPKY